MSTAKHGAFCIKTASTPHPWVHRLSLELPWFKASNWKRRASEKAVQYSSPNLAPKKTKKIDGNSSKIFFLTSEVEMDD